ncbi:hypothetical protein CASFOL_000185 [Castilleja foliolosa]|uniref:Uncharacterized protein n=1 Tax=Castilleja foliolosa TaxID=1961234 RepID=A0ABD3ERV7_9LAMI
MSIRFKFRSSVNFDTLEIGDRGSIAVGELRTKILKGKQQHQGFDLVFSDAVSGLEFKGDDCQISNGSSVIVRRVPAGTLPSAVSPIQAVKDVGMKESHNRSPANAPVDEFDNLGADFMCPVPDSNFPDFSLELDQNDFMDNEVQAASLRLECQEHGPSDHRKVIPKGCDQSGNEKNILARVDQQINSNKLPTSNFPAEQCTNLPVEMKCPVCNTFFKEAVMIPCCQHSFCQNCIRQVLIEKGKCPKCFSSKCSVGDLLPNLSLRQAVEHFLEAQMLDAGLENAMQKYVPDGESGIQAKDFSCALSVVQKDLKFIQSSCATGKGSNPVHTEAFYNQQRQRNVPFGTSDNRDIKSNFPPLKVNQVDNMSGYPHINNMQRRPGDLEPSADFQGENQPVIPLANVHYEAESNTNRQGGFWMDSGGGDRNFSGFGGHRKGIRTCYTCGSPDHLMRDCPMPHQNPMFQPGNGAFHGGMPGYAAPYWNGSSMPPFSPYANMYSNPAMMPFNASMVPVSPFAAPHYYPSMVGGLPGPGQNMRMGNMGPPPHPEHFGLQHCENKRKHPTEDLERHNISDKDDSPERYRYNTPETSHDCKQQKETKSSRTRSDDSYGRKSSGKTQHNKHLHSDVHNVDARHEKGSRSSYSGSDKRPSHGEKSNSGKEDASRSSEGRHKHHHGESKKYHHDRKGQHYENDSSYVHHSAQKDAKRRVESGVRDSHKGYKERDAGHDHQRKHSREEHRDDRWQMANKDFDEDRRDEYRYHKRRAN